MKLAAERWEGTGNVYLIVDRDTLPQALTDAAAQNICGLLGGDGILEVRRNDGADVSMRVWNPDGTESEACGNGTRMVARWLSEQTGQRIVKISTIVGVLHCVVTEDRISAQLAPARFAGSQYAPTDDSFPYPHTFVSVGNPHVVIPVDDVTTFPLLEEGHSLEHHSWFPERVNVEIVMPIDRHRVRMRVWERGVGETRACGSGACAVAVAAIAAGTADSPVTVELPGGELVVEVGAAGAVTMHGPAQRVEYVVFSADLLA